MLTAALGFWPASPSVAATIEVTTVDDEVAVDGDCSLREAMVSANDNVSADDCAKGEGGSDRDVIKLDAADYNLDIDGLDEDAGQTGDLDYTGGGKLTIRGKGIDSSEIAANATDDRVIHALDRAKELRLEKLELDDGAAPSGGLVYVGDGALVLKRVEALSGSAESLGGGVFYAGDQGLKVDRSVFSINEATAAGALYSLSDGPEVIRRTIFENNTASGGASRGGAIYANGARVIDTTFVDNGTVSDGGGSALGAAIYGSDMKIERTMFANNDSEELNEAVGADGGAVRLFGKSAITNSTFYGNDSADDGGALAGEAKLAHVTFLQNSAEGQGDHIESFGDGVFLRNSILPGAAIAVDVCAGDAVVSKGFNVFTYDDAGCGTLDSDVTDGGNAGLVAGPAENGGPTETISITPKSIAKDLVPKRKCKPAKGVDQRGYERPRGPRCDAGAYEQGAQPD